MLLSSNVTSLIIILLKFQVINQPKSKWKTECGTTPLPSDAMRARRSANQRMLLRCIGPDTTRAKFVLFLRKTKNSNVRAVTKGININMTSHTI
jgi:hypothetical protein